MGLLANVLVRRRSGELQYFSFNDALAIILLISSHRVACHF